MTFCIALSILIYLFIYFTENWSDIIDRSSYRDASNNFAPEDDSSIYGHFTNSHNNLLPEDEDTNFLSRFLNNLPNIDEEDSSNTYDKFRENDNDMVMDATSFLDKVPCEVGVADECPFNAECIPLGLKTRNGICKCVLGTEENSQGSCVQSRPFSKGPTIDTGKRDDEVSDTKSSDVKNEPSPKTIQNLTVSIKSKTVRFFKLK